MLADCLAGRADQQANALYLQFSLLLTGTAAALSGRVAETLCQATFLLFLTITLWFRVLHYGEAGHGFK